MKSYKVIDEVSANRDSWKIVEAEGGKRIAYLLTDEGYVADFDATDSSDPGRTTVWFDATDEGFQAKRQGKEVTNAHGEPVTIVSAESYGMPNYIEDLD